VRNQFRTPAIYQFDARLTRSIRLGEKFRVRLIAEAFNLFNRANVATVNNTYFAYSGGAAGTLSFPSPVSAFGTPRTFGVAGVPAPRLSRRLDRFNWQLSFDF
jgi:hypothetical protein